MKTIYAIILAIMITGSKAVAFGSGNDDTGISLLTTLLLSFGAVIILFQFLPGITLFFGMLKGLYSSTEKKAVSIK